MDQYLPIVVLLVLAVVFGVLSALVSKLLAPRLETEAKAAPYECGIVPGKDPPERFPVRFYLVAMIFIVFDIEIIFLYPWAVDLPPARRVRAVGDRDLRGRRVRVVRVPDLATARSTGARSSGCAASDSVDRLGRTRTTHDPTGRPRGPCDRGRRPRRGRA